MLRRVLLIAVVFGTLTWTATLVAAPALAATRTRTGSTVSALTYAAGALVCHQMSARSFHVDGAQLPVCARCLGLYGGASIGALAWAVGLLGRPRERIRRRARDLRAPVLMAAAPTFFTVGTSWLGVWDPGNAVRFVLALPLGAAAGLLVAAFVSGHLE